MTSAAKHGQAWLTAAALLAGVVTAPANAARPDDVDWRRVATTADRARLRNWRDSWVLALAAERTAGHGAAIAADPLFDPDRSIEGVALPGGTYRCRTFKLGRRHDAARPITPSAWNPCTVGDDDGAVTFRTGGVQRFAGNLFDRTDARGVFLGTLVLGDEPRPMRYGRDTKRDAAGIIERIGEHRWRLVLPYPAFESMLDIVEIAPAG